MPRKTYNSESARELAKEYKITLTKIPATRSDLKITVKNVKDYIKSQALPKKAPVKKAEPKKAPVKKAEPKKKTEPKKAPVKKAEPKKKSKPTGYHVRLVIKPVGQYDIDLSSIEKYHNIDKLVEYYTSFLPTVGYASGYFANPRVSSELVSGEARIVFDFDVTTRNDEELELAIQLASDLDDDGNYPIKVINGRIISTDARSESKDAPGVMLVGERVVSKTITDI